MGLRVNPEIMQTHVHTLVVTLGGGPRLRVGVEAASSQTTVVAQLGNLHIAGRGRDSGATVGHADDRGDGCAGKRTSLWGCTLAAAHGLCLRVQKALRGHPRATNSTRLHQLSGAQEEAFFGKAVARCARSGDSS